MRDTFLLDIPPVIFSEMTTLDLRGRLDFALGYDISVLKCRLGHGKMGTINANGGIISKKK